MMSNPDKRSDDNKDLPLMTSGCLGLCLCIWVGPLFLLTSLVCLITSLSTSHWLEQTNDEGTLTMHGGLFEWTRIEYNGSYISWDDYPHLDTVYVKLSIAALIISAIGYLLGFFAMCLFVLSVLSESGISWNGHSLWSGACVLNGTGIGFFARFQFQSIGLVRPLSELDYGWSFHLSWISLLLAIVGSVTTIAAAICCGGDVDEITPIDTGGGADNPVREENYAQQKDSNL